MQRNQLKASRDTRREMVGAWSREGDMNITSILERKLIGFVPSLNMENEREESAKGDS